MANDVGMKLDEAVDALLENFLELEVESRKAVERVLKR
jgi:hypothetical protein